MQLKEPPTAIFSANIITSLGAMRAAHEYGFKIPDDISIVSVHDVDFTPVLNPALTTIKMPLYQMGQAAVQKIIENIKNKLSNQDMHGIVIKGGELIVRESTKALDP